MGKIVKKLVQKSGDNSINVGGDFNQVVVTAEAVFAMFCLGLLKKTIVDNVMDNYSDEERKEAHARLIKLCIMFIISAFVVAFFYPVLFENSEMGILATRLSDVVAGGFLLTTAGFIKFRDMARAAICENLRKRQGDKK